MLEALERALQPRRAEALIHHSDQGCPYTSVAFTERCREVGVAVSMGSVGDCYDNAMAASCFAPLECEIIPQRRLRNRAEARQAVFSFLAGWSNTRRRHSALGDQSPRQFEAEYHPSHKRAPVH